MNRLAIVLVAAVVFSLPPGASISAAASPEEIWKSLEKLPAAEREKKLIEGAKSEGEMVWYTNTGLENANRYIQAFKKAYPFTNPKVWRAKTRQVTQRVIAEANAGRNLVDVIKPSTDLLPALLEKNLIGRYETPLRAIYPVLSKGTYFTNMNYAFRVFAFNPLVKIHGISRFHLIASQPEVKLYLSPINFDPRSLPPGFKALFACTADRLVHLSGPVRLASLTLAALMAISAGIMRLGRLRGPVDWVAEDLIPALMYPLTMARNAPHPYSAALFYDFVLSEPGQQLIAKEGRVVAHPKVEPIYPRMKELQNFLGTPRVQLNTVEQNHTFYKDGLQILDEIVLKQKSS